eukprot:3169526-Pyramimonas_sp.AAC.2
MEWCVIQCIWMNFKLTMCVAQVKEFARLDGIVTMVDAKHVEQHLDEEKPEGAENESVEQVAFADRLLLNKTDLVTEADLKRVEARLSSINKFAPMQRCEQSKVSVDNVLNIRGFDLKRTLEMDPEFLNTDNEHEHDQTVTSLCITEPGEVDLDAVQKFVGQVLIVMSCMPRGCTMYHVPNNSRDFKVSGTVGVCRCVV